MVRLLVASVLLVCVLCQSAFGVLLRGEARGIALASASDGFGAGTELTLTFAVDTKYPYRVTPLVDNEIYLNTPAREYCISGVGLSLGYNGFAGGDGGFVGPDSRMYMYIPAPGIYGDPSVVLTPAMMPTATLVFSQVGPTTNYEWAYYTILQDAPITWTYVPEPSAYALGLMAIAGLLLFRHRTATGR